MLSFLIERNVVNLQDIPAFIKSLAQRAETEQGKKWLQTTLRNWIINKFEGATRFDQLPPATQQNLRQNGPDWLERAIERGEPLYYLDFNSNAATELRQHIDHVIDYFNANPEERLERVSVEAAEQAADKWTEAQSRKAAVEEDANGVKEMLAFPDGYRWVEVISPEALNREGQLMKHCVGSYATRVESGNVRILSLRDSMNKPHVTIEFRKDDEGGDSIEQIKGNSNQAPKKEYIPYIGALFTKYDMRVGSGGKYDLQRISPTIHVMADGRAIDLGHLSGTFKGSLYLDTSDMRALKRGEKQEGGLTLGDGTTQVTVDGDMFFDDEEGRYGNTRKGPFVLAYKQIHVVGDAGIASVFPVVLPHAMVVDKDFDLHRAHKVKMPNDLSVGGDLFLPPIPVKLPEKLEVRGVVHAPSALRGKVSFPADLTVRYV